MQDAYFREHSGYCEQMLCEFVFFLLIVQYACVELFLQKQRAVLEERLDLGGVLGDSKWSKIVCSAQCYSGTILGGFRLSVRGKHSLLTCGTSFWAPESAHHPLKNHVEHLLCNPGGGVYFALLLGSDNSCTTPSKYPFLDWKSCVVVVYGWWSPISAPERWAPVSPFRATIGGKKRLVNCRNKHFWAKWAQKHYKSEKRLIRWTFWDTLWEQFPLSHQSALIDASLWRKTL